MSEVVDMSLLHRSFLVTVAIRGMYERIKRNPAGRFFVYVLLLQEGKFYVGSTDNPYSRLWDHFRCSSNSALWVREWGPPVRVVEIARNCSPEDEHYKYAEYADKFGWMNVRGGGCCRLVMSREPSSVARFARKPDTLEYLTRAEIDDLVAKIAHCESHLKSQLPH